MARGFLQLAYYTNFILRQGKSSALQRSSVLNSIFLASGDSSGNDSDLVHYRAQFVAFELRALSAIGGLPRIPFV